MVIHEKALVRDMKEAYKGWGYTVLRLPWNRWVFYSRAWAVAIEGQNNVPNALLSLIVLHMGYLPETETAYRIYKTDTGPAVQQEVYETALESFRALELQRHETDEAPVRILRTKLMLGRCRVWQQEKDLGIALIDPTFESILEDKKNVRRVGEAIYAGGAISCVYIMRVKNDANKAQLAHLEQMQWVEA